MRKHWLLALLAVLVVPALVWADEPAQDQGKVKDKDVGKAYIVPFRLTDSAHIMVRVKINGKGPYNFIVDTGAPLVYVSVPVAKKLGIEAEKKGQNTVARFEIEGGPLHTDWKCLIDTPFQLEGMNALGMAGVELHGIIGYTLLSHYKMEIDLTKDRMTWTKLDFTPPVPESLGIKGAPGGLDMLGKLMKFMAAMSSTPGLPDPDMRGFVGVELKAKDQGVVVQGVLAKSPAAAAGVQAGDRLLRVQDKLVVTPAQVMEVLAKVKAGQPVVFLVERGGQNKEITITAGEGL